MTAQQQIPAPIPQESCPLLADCAHKQHKQQPSAPRRRSASSFFATPQVFQKARSGLKKTAPTSAGSPTPLLTATKTTTLVTPTPTTTTKTITHTKMQIVQGQKITETTTTTVTKPTLPKGFRGKLIKTLNRNLNKKITHQVITRQTTPLADEMSTTGQINCCELSVVAAPDTKKKTRGVRRSSTPMPVTNGMSTKSFSAAPQKPPMQAPSNLNSVAEAPEITAAEAPKPQVVSPPVKNDSTNNKRQQRGVRRASTPMPVSHGGSLKAFFAPKSSSKKTSEQPLLDCVVESTAMIAPSKNDSPKKQRGVQRSSTPMPVAHGGASSTKKFFAPSSSSSTKALAPPSQPLLGSVIEVPEPEPMLAPANNNDSPRKKQRGVQRTSTPMPVPHGGSTNTFFSKPTVTAAAAEPVLDAVVEGSEPKPSAPLRIPVAPETGSPKKQRGVRRASTPMPVPHGKSLQRFFAKAPSNKTPVVAAEQPLLESVVEGPAEPQSLDCVVVEGPTQKPPVKKDSSKKQQRGVRRASTPMPVPHGGSLKAFFTPPTTKPLVAVAPESSQPLNPVVEGPKRGVSRIVTPAPAQNKKSFFAPPQSPMSVADPIHEMAPQVPLLNQAHAGVDVTCPSPSHPATVKQHRNGRKPMGGLPTMFANSFGNNNKTPTKRKVKSPKQPRIAPRVPTTSAALSSPSSAPFPTSNGRVDSSAADAVSEYDEFTVLEDDEKASEYDEFTILDDEVYEITYFEEETVMSGSQQHTKDAASKSNSTLKLEGMELLLANIRIKVPTVN